MPALLQTHPNHSSSSTRERLKRWSQRRKTELLSLFWDWVFYAVCWKWLTILWNEFDGTQLSLCRTNTRTWAKTRQMQLSSWQPPGSPCSWHRRRGRRGPPSHGSSSLTLTGAAQRSFCCHCLFGACRSPFQSVTDFSSSACQAAPFL